MTSPDASGVVCVFAKPPRPGEVKTRLAAEIGAGAAARLATAFLEDTLVSLRRLPLRVVLASTEPGVYVGSPVRKVGPAPSDEWVSHL